MIVTDWGSDDARQAANTVTSEYVQVLQAADKQVCLPFNILLSKKNIYTKDSFSSTPQNRLGKHILGLGIHGLP